MKRAGKDLKAGKAKWVILLLLAGLVLFALPCRGGVILSDAPDYAWWYGCSPTSVGMLMGYYDRHGYDGLLYPDLVPGGVAELNTYGGGSYLVNDIIASSGHIADFYSDAPPPGDDAPYYGDSGDDVEEPWHSFDCLADFMGTSQDAADNSNGATRWWNYTDGTKLTDTALFAMGPDYWSTSGLCGITEYVEYVGYEGTGYNQYVDSYVSGGFGFDDYRGEIDAGRPVLIHLAGHTMFGYGYDETTNEIILHDTWSEGEHRMTWGGSYGGMELQAVTVYQVSGGVPEPVGLSLLAFGAGAFVAWRARRKRRPQGKAA